MGIPKLWGDYIKKNNLKVLLDELPKVISSLLLDVNGIIHKARMEIYGDKFDEDEEEALRKERPESRQKRMFESIGKLILGTVETYKPRDLLIVAVDGVAPGAKIQQQRGRREKAVKDREGEILFDGNSISPGTDFMFELDVYLNGLLKEKRNFLPETVIYSPHSVPGEGEHKIMDYCRSNIMKNGNHILYGLDADLIMLSLMSPLEGIILSREDSEIMSIEMLKDEIRKMSIRTEEPYIFHDFVVATTLIGNDFLPKSPSLSDISKSINEIVAAYNDSSEKIKLTSSEGIDFGEFIKFVGNLKKDEAKRINDLSNKFKNSKMIKDAIREDVQTFNITNFRASWYKNALGNRSSSSFQSQVESIVGFSLDPITKENAKGKVKNMIISYLEMISWVYDYYLLGTFEVSQEASYDYYHAPLLKDIYDFGLHERFDGIVYERKGTYTMLHQLLSVLPSKSSDLLPKPFRAFTAIDSPIKDYYIENFIIEMDMAITEDSGIPIIPMIDRQRIREVIGTIQINKSEAARYVEGNDLILTRTKEEQSIFLGRLRQTKNKPGKFGERKKFEPKDQRRSSSKPERPNRRSSSKPIRTFDPDELEESKSRRSSPERKSSSPKRRRSSPKRRTFDPDELETDDFEAKIEKIPEIQVEDIKPKKKRLRFNIEDVNL